ncbi:unnamed protein product [Moneuplotes crassus]|uniref:BZIP domain-containing protein n=1 Tax=Euplotes crassus TaxID=5936 RepID=A0AAD1UKP9_EUPCR|nr:unnamed protein product [Moneuplotes crassus]
MEDLNSNDLKRKPPKTNKERSRQHRIRKKKFIEEIQQECKDLRVKVKTLEEENKQLKEALTETKVSKLKYSKCKQERKQFDHSLHEYEDYLYNNLGNKVLEDPDQVRYSTIEHAVEHVYEFSDDRIDYIKSLFNKILDNMISHGTKCFSVCHNVVPIKKWDVNIGLKKRGRKYFDKASETDIIQNAFKNIAFTEQAKQTFTTFNKIMTSQNRKAKKIAQNLIKLRNNLLNLYQDMKATVVTSSQSNWYKKQDMYNHFQLIQRISSTGLITNHKVYDIPKKEHKEEKYQDGELTE